MRCARPTLLVFIGWAALGAGCGRDHGNEHVLPPRSAWKPPPAQPSQVEGGRERRGGGADEPSGAAPDDPHAGLDMGDSGDPHASPTGDQDPHAGLDLDGEGAVAPGSDGGANPAAMAGGSAPDPGQPTDPSKILRGTIRAGQAVSDAIKPGSVLFLGAWPVDPATGAVRGAPVAVAKLTVQKLPMPFELSGMPAGTQSDGDVVIRARVDGDGEARTREPGDVEGSLRARVPAQDLDLVLDTPIR